MSGPLNGTAVTGTPTLSRGAGTTYVSAANTYTSSGWDAASEGAAVTATDYVQFSLNATHFRALHLLLNEVKLGSGANAGAKYARLYYSSNGTAGPFTALGTTYYSTPSSDTAHDFDLSAVAALNNCPNVVLRLFGWAAGKPTGQYALHALSVTATPDPAISVATSLAFGAIADGATLDKNLTINNNNAGTQNALTIANTTALSGTDAARFSIVTTLPLTVPAGGSANLVLRYTPAGERRSHAATLQIKCDDLTQPSVNVSLSGSATGPVIGTSPASLSFGSKDIDEGSTGPLTVTIQNTGNGPLNFSEGGIALAGDHADQFQFVGTPSTGPITAGGNRQIQVAFDPSATGSTSASLILNTNDYQHPTITIPLSGTGLDQEVDISPLSLGFGDQDVHPGPTASQTITITNQGNTALHFMNNGIELTGANVAEFLIANNPAKTPLGPGESRTVEVAFDPSTKGAKTAGLTITTDDADESVVNIPLTGNGLNSGIEVSGGLFTFGSRDIDEGATAATSLTLTNSGSVNAIQFIGQGIEITGTGAAHFQLIGTPASTPLSPGETRTVEVTFDPSSVGDKSASVAITTDDPYRPTITFPLTGTGIDQEITVEGSPLNFGSKDVDEGSTGPLTVTIRNDGTNTLRFTNAGVALAGDDVNHFTIVGTPDLTPLAPGQSRTVAVSFDPATTGTKTASLLVTTDDTDEPEVNVPLSGTGIDQEITVEGGPLSFGSWDVDAGTTGPLTVTIRNDGTNKLSFSGAGFALTGSDAGQFSISNSPAITPLAPGESRTVEVAFNPSTMGDKTANLHITSDDTDEPAVDVALSGTGIDQQVDVAPLTLAFGSWDLDDGSTGPLTVTIKNVGTNMLNFTGAGLALSGTGASQFQFVGNPSKGPLAPGESRTVQVAFDPSSLGAKSANLVVTTDDTDKTTVNVALSGTGVDQEVTITPASLSFGQQDVIDGPTAPQTVTIKNDGTNSLHFTGAGIALTGAGASEFAIVNNPPKDPLAPGQSLDVQVTFEPNSTGAKSASLVITTDDTNESNVGIPLSGTGTNKRAVIAAWQNANLNVTGSVAATTGTATLSRGAGSSYKSVANSYGSTGFENKRESDARIENDYVQISVDATHFRSLSLRLHDLRSSDGPDMGRIYYSSTGTGGTFSSLSTTFSPVTTDTSRAFDLSTITALDNNPNVVLRIMGWHADAAAGQYSINSIAVTGTPDPSIGVPTAVDFGTISAITTVDKTLAITNSGTSNTLTISKSSLISGPDAACFSIVTALPLSIAKGGNANLTLRYTPAGDHRSHAATLQIKCNDYNQRTALVSLNGTATGPEVETAPASLDFSNQDVHYGPTASQVVTITNQGSDPLQFTAKGIELTGPNSSEFTIISDPDKTPLAPGQSRTVEVAFDPSSRGAKSANLTITTDDTDESTVNILLTGNGLNDGLEVLGVPLNFGGKDIDEGATAATSFTLTNCNGVNTIQFASTGIEITGADAGLFQIIGNPASAPLAPGETRVVEVTFDPASVGEKSASLNIATDDAYLPAITVPLTGTGIDQEITVEGSPLSFGNMDVDAGSTGPLTLTIRNSGANKLNFTGAGIAMTGTDSNQFAIVGTPDLTALAPGQSRTVTVSFDPATPGTKTASLLLTTDDTDEPEISVPLSGTGIDQEITVEGAPLSFGSWDVDADTTGPLTVTIRNDGTNALSFTGAGIALAGPDAGQFAITNSPAITPLAPGESRTVQVAFNPTTMGDKTASLHITSDDTDEPAVDVALSGTGIDQQVDVAPLTVAFGNWDIDEGSTGPLTVTIKNVGTNTLKFTGAGLALSGTGASQFQLVGNPSTGPLAPGESRTVQVAFDPSSLGAKSANLAITTDDTDKTTVNVALSGTGVDQDVTVTPASLTFALQDVDDGQSTAQTVTIKNTGTNTLHFTGAGIALAGAYASEFAISNNPAKTPLAPGQSVQVQVTINPASSGAKTANLVVTTDVTSKPSVSVPLSGSGAYSHAIVAAWQDANLNVAGSAAATTGTATLSRGAGAASASVANFYASTGFDKNNESTAKSSNDYIQMSVDATHFRALSLRLNDIRSSNGPTSARVYYSSTGTGGTFNTIGATFAPATSNTARTIDLSTLTALNNNPNVVLRIYAWSANSATDQYNVHSVSVTGTPDPSIGVPTALDFGTTSALTTVDKTLTITNTATSNTLIVDKSSIIAGPDAACFSIVTALPLSIAKGGNATLTLRYTPAGDHRSHAAILELKSNDYNRRTALVSLIGTATGPEIEAATDPLDFGLKDIDEGSTGPLTITIKNTGTEALNFTGNGIEITGDGASQFQLVGSPATGPIAPGESRQVQVAFDPGALGDTSASLVLSTNDFDEPTVTIGLGGTGIDQEVAVSPLALSFGSKDVDEGSTGPLTVTITNEGSNTLHFTDKGIALAGTDAAEFLIANNPSVTPLEPGESRTVEVAFDPSTPGAKSASLTITTDDTDEATVNVALDGTGIDQEVTVDQSALGFGERDVDEGAAAAQTVTIKNDGTNTLHFTAAGIAISGDNADQFAIANSPAITPLEPGESRTVEVAFDPATVGPKSASLVITTDDTDEPAVSVALSGTGIDQEVTVEGGPLNFGAWDMDEGATAVQSVTIKNIGTNTLHFTGAGIALAGTDAAQFAISNSPAITPLAPGESRTVAVIFDPASTGLKTASLLVSTDDTDEPEVGIPLGGTGIDQEITVEGGPFAFGSRDVDDGPSVAQTVTIHNDGTNNLNFIGAGIALAGTDAAQFTITNNPAITPLAPGESRTVEVAFDPSLTGDKSASLRITTDDTDESTIDVALSGTGIDQEAAVSSEALAFGSKDIDEGSTGPLAVTLTNTGTNTLHFTGGGIALAGADASQFSFVSKPVTTSLEPGQSCTVEVLFDPSSTGSKTASLMIPTDDTDKKQINVALSGTGIDQEVSVDQSTLGFGERDVDLGAAPKQVVTIKNEGTNTLRFTSAGIAISGANADQFSFVSTPATTPLAPGESRTVEVTFDPATVGQKSATLVITTDDTDEATLNVALSGTGIDQEVAIDQSSLNFGSWDIDSGSTGPLTLTISNKGTNALGFTGAGLVLTGADAGQFAITNNPATTPLAPGESRTVQVAFDPSIVGAKSATLVILTDDTDKPSSEISLSGTGIDQKVTVTPASLSFGSKDVDEGSTGPLAVTIRNEGTNTLSFTSVGLELAGPNAAEFVMVNKPAVTSLKPGEEISVNVAFDPASAGAKSASLVITTNDTDKPTVNVALSGTGIDQEVSVDQSALSFGSKDIDEGSTGPLTVTITNEGSNTLHFTGAGLVLTGADAGQFAIINNPATTPLAPGESRQVQLAFDPSSIGDKSASLVIATDDTNEPQVTIPLSGLGIDQEISVNQAALSFGERDVDLGAAAKKVVTIKNDGTNTLSFTSPGIAISGANADQFSFVGTPATTPLAPGESRTVEILFDPTTVGQKSASLVITTDDTDESTVNVALSGTGIDQEVAVDLSSLSFGAWDVDSGSTGPLTLTITNKGTNTLGFTGAGLVLTGADAGQFAITNNPTTTSLAPGESRAVEVAFDPSSTGAKSATLIIMTDDTNKPSSEIILSGTGIDQKLAVTPASLSFGSKDIDEGSTGPLAVTIRNEGTNTLSFTSVGLEITGANAAEFVIVNQPAVTALKPGEEISVNVAFDPATTGVKSANLVVSTNDTDKPSLSIPLGGTGIDQKIAVSSTSLDFGNWNVDEETTGPLMVTITNEGSNTLSFTGDGLKLTGTNAGDFHFLDDPTTTPLAPGESRKVQLGFNPSSMGAKSASLLVTSDDTDEPAVNVQLTGVGVDQKLVATDGPIDFSEQDVDGGATLTKVVELTNNGNTDLHFTGDMIKLVGANYGDFSIINNPLTTALPAGQTRRIEVKFTPWNKGEKKAELVVSSDGGVADVALVGTGVNETIGFATESASVSEAAGEAKIAVKLDRPASQGGVAVNYAVTGGTAAGGGKEYSLLGTGTLNFAPGQTEGTISLSIINDQVDEFDKTVVLTLSNPAKAELGAAKTFTLTIVDDDEEPIVSFAVSSLSAMEANADVPLSLVYSGNETEKPIKIDYKAGGGSAVEGTDYNAASGTLSLTPMAANIGQPVVHLLDDKLPDGNKTVVVTLSGAVNAKLGPQTSCTITILDDDPKSAAKDWAAYE